MALGIGDSAEAAQKPKGTTRGSGYLEVMERLARHYKLICFDQRASGKSSVNVDSSSMLEVVQPSRRFAPGAMPLSNHRRRSRHGSARGTSTDPSCLGRFPTRDPQRLGTFSVHRGPSLSSVLHSRSSILLTRSDLPITVPALRYPHRCLDTCTDYQSGQIHHVAKNHSPQALSLQLIISGVTSNASQ